MILPCSLTFWPGGICLAFIKFVNYVVGRVSDFPCPGGPVLGELSILLCPLFL